MTKFMVTGHKNIGFVPNRSNLGTKGKFYMKNGKGFAMPVPCDHKVTAGQESISWEVLHQCGGCGVPPTPRLQLQLHTVT